MVDRKAEYEAKVRALPAETLADMFLQLDQQLLNPPKGWFTFGTHSDRAIPCYLWGTDESGMPIWEKPYTFEEMRAAEKGSLPK